MHAKWIINSVVTERVRNYIACIQNVSNLTKKYRSSYKRTQTATTTSENKAESINFKKIKAISLYRQTAKTCGPEAHKIKTHNVQ
jgi:hypothetical protein